MFIRFITSLAAVLMALSACVSTPSITVQQHANSAFELFELEKPWPTVHVVESNNPIFSKPGVLAQAVIYPATGVEEIYINEAAISQRTASRDQKMRRGKDFLKNTIGHEASHIRLWRTNGHDVAEHGSEFYAVCGEKLSTRHCSPVH